MGPGDVPFKKTIWRKFWKLFSSARAMKQFPPPTGEVFDQETDGLMACLSSMGTCDHGKAIQIALRLSRWRHLNPALSTVSDTTTSSAREDFAAYFLFFFIVNNQENIIDDWNDN